MSNNMYYWKKYLENSKKFNLTMDSSILFIKLENKIIDKKYKDWVFFPNKEKCIEFLKYVIIPSTYFSELLGTAENTIILDSISKKTAIELFKLVYSQEINSYNHMIRDYRIIEKVERKYEYEKMFKFIDNFNNYFNSSKEFSAYICFYEDVSALGRELESICEDKESTALLEDCMCLPKEEIRSLFKNIDQNLFNLRRIEILLKEKDCIDVII